MILTDLHTHTIYSFDGNDSMETLCRGAIKNGIKVLAPTEHFDLSPTSGDSYFYNHNEERKKNLQICQEQFANELILLNGIELGQAYINIPEAEKVLQSNDFDFVIGSVHNLVDGSDVYTIDYRTHEQSKEIMDLYLEEVYKTALLSDYDSLGHIDFPLRKMEKVYLNPSNYSMKIYEEKIREILKVIIKRGKALEINTRGLICWEKCICPEDWILKAYKEYGGKLLTVGSDSHFSQYIGLGTSESYQALQRTGFKEIVYYKNRQPVFMEI